MEYFVLFLSMLNVHFCNGLMKFILSIVDSNVDHFTPNLRRRFLRHDYQKRIFHASQEVQRSARRQELEQERGRRHEANIASFRKYRSGDFPDIEIPYCAVIRPMQELAKVGFCLCS